MNDTIENATCENGTCRDIDGIPHAYYEGYWIKHYDAPQDNLTAKKELILSLTRRLFNHMEHGINIPGKKLDAVRAAYEAEHEPKKKRVKGAMLAGALFNRAADIFTHLVDLEASGVKVDADSDLMHTCGDCLREALEFGKMVKHRNGDEGIDELWGEPFKAFVMSIEDFYKSRYVKIAMTMKNIDMAASHMIQCVKDDPRFEGLEQAILNFAEAAKDKCETLRTDDDIYEVWTDFVVAGEEVTDFVPLPVKEPEGLIDALDIKQMLKAGIRLIAFITRARTPMPKSTESYLQECLRYKNRTC